MSKILISFFSGLYHNDEIQVGTFFDGLSKALIRNGNEVLLLATDDFLPVAWNGYNRPTRYHKNYIQSKIKKFDPDLIITFNNSFIEGVERIVNCPIIVWDSDTFQYFNEKEKLIENKDRYTFLSFSTQGIKDYKKVGIEKSFLVKIGSEVQSKKMEKKYNISFIGNPFFNSTEKCYDFYKLQNDLKKKDSFFLSGVKRLRILEKLLESGLAIFGPREWLILQNFNINFSNCYKDENVFSHSHNELIYNRSNFSINIPHKQNITGMPFRVADIVRSDSLLITEYKSDFFNDLSFQKELDFLKKNIVYVSENDVKSKIEYLTNNKQLLTELKEAQAKIGKLYSWDSKIKEIQEITNINIFSENKKNSNLIKKEQTLRINHKNDYYDFFIIFYIKIINFCKKRFNNKFFKLIERKINYIKYKYSRSLLLIKKIKKNPDIKKEYK